VRQLGFALSGGDFHPDRRDAHHLAVGVIANQPLIYTTADTVT